MNRYKPTNEQGVIYYFSKYHKDLGFEEVTHMTSHFPDVHVLKDNVKYKIELEWKLSGIYDHYVHLPHVYDNIRWDWREDKGQWWTFRTDKDDWDTSCNYTVTEFDKYEVNRVGDLVYKTLKPLCDCVVYWVHDCELDDNLDLINLKDWVFKR